MWVGASAPVGLLDTDQARTCARRVTPGAAEPAITAMGRDFSLALGKALAKLEQMRNYGELAIQSEGFVFQAPKRGWFWQKPPPPFLAAFPAIERVIALKLDLITIDEVVFDIWLEDGRGIRICESAKGFIELDAAFAEHLPGYFRDWRGVVIFPAFEENRTVIFQRMRERVY